MIPTSIDGTDITGATIDGTDVQEITVDGDVVFSATSDLPVAYSDLVAWYPFDSAEYGGSNADDVTAILGGSGDDTAYDGTVNGATYQSTSGSTDIRAGTNSGAYNFNDIDDDIDLSGPFGQFSELSVTCWVNIDSGPVWSYSSASQNNDSQFVRASNTQPYMFLRGTGGNTAIRPSSFPTNQFVHTAVTSDGSFTQVYIDGSVVGTDNTNIGLIDPQEWKIGSDDVIGGEDQSADGIIDDFRIYDIELSSSQINQIIQNTQP